MLILWNRPTLTVSLVVQVSSVTTPRSINWYMIFVWSAIAAGDDHIFCFFVFLFFFLPCHHQKYLVLVIKGCSGFTTGESFDFNFCPTITRRGLDPWQATGDWLSEAPTWSLFPILQSLIIFIILSFFFPLLSSSSFFFPLKKKEEKFKKTSKYNITLVEALKKL